MSKVRRPVTSKARTRKPEPKPDTYTHREHLGIAESYLTLAARHIDTAGDLAGTDQADMLACFASNVLQGSLSLIRELRRSLRDTRGTEAAIRNAVAEEVIAAFQLGECTGDDHADYLRKVIGRPRRDTRGKR